MDKINELYSQVKNLEDVLSEYNTSKNRIKLLETDIYACEAFLEGKERIKIESKIKELERESVQVENELKKIDLCSKDCFSLSDIKMMFEFVEDEEILRRKATAYLESLIYPIYIDSTQVEGVFKPASYKENFKASKGTFKVLKINLEINSFFNLLKCRPEIFQLNQEVLRKILKTEMGVCIPSRMGCYVDSHYLYLLSLSSSDEESSEEYFFKDLAFVGMDYLNNLDNLIDTFNEIFKKNLCKLLVKCSVSCEDIEDTNLFLSQTEYFITNVEEWKLDCAMKEIITLSKRERKWETVDWLEEGLALGKNNVVNQKSVFYFSQDVLKKTEMLPREISKGFFSILLCVKILLSCKSKRIEKAEKIVERALLKMMSQKPQGHLLHQFVVFSDLSVFVRLFPDSAISSTITNVREEVFFTISKASTELNRSLNDSLMLLKVYFKEKHYDFMLFVDKFVPRRSKMAFEINFFNLLYENVCDNILCIKYVDNDKVADISRLVQYILDLSFQVPKGCIEQYKRLESFGYIFRSPIDEIINKADHLVVSKEDLSILLSLLFKPSAQISIFLESFDGTN